MNRRGFRTSMKPPIDRIRYSCNWYFFRFFFKFLFSSVFFSKKFKKNFELTCFVLKTVFYLIGSESFWHGFLAYARLLITTSQAMFKMQAKPGEEDDFLHKLDWVFVICEAMSVSSLVLLFFMAPYSDKVLCQCFEEGGVVL